MATVQEPKKLKSSKDILPYLKKAKTDRDALKAELATASPKNRSAIQTKYNTAKDQVDTYQKMYDDAKDREDAASEAVAEKSADVKLKQSAAQTRIKIAEDAVIASGKRFRGDPNDEDKYTTYQNAMAALASQYDNFDAKGFVFPRIINSVEGGYVEADFAPAGSNTDGDGITAPPAPPKSTTGAAATGAAATDATTIKSKRTVVKNGKNVEVTTYMDGHISEKILGPSTLSDTSASNLPEDNRGDAAANQKAYVDAQLKAKGLADTPENRKTLRAAYQALTPEEKIAAVAALPGAKIPPVVDNAWEQLFIKNNPAKAWYLTELDRAKYPQLFAILKEYALARPLTVEEQAAFAAKLDGTDFFRELSTSGKIREIKKVVGDLGFDGSDFTKFVHTAINMGYTGDRLKEETYKEVFKKVDGKYVNPIAFKRVIAGNDYLNVKLIGKQYFNEVSSDTIEKVLTGEIGITDVQRQQRYLAGKTYGHLNDLLEQGLTMQDIASSYQTSAAKLLEVDPELIDMSAVDYEIALNFGEEGKKRIMTSGEWDRLLRTESKYGWEKTNNAKQEARGLASSLVQAFGRII